MARYAEKSRKEKLTPREEFLRDIEKYLKIPETLTYEIMDKLEARFMRIARGRPVPYRHIGYRPEYFYEVLESWRDNLERTINGKIV